MPFRPVLILLFLVLIGAGAVLPLLAREGGASGAASRTCAAQRCESAFNSLQGERAKRFSAVFRN